MNETNKAMQSGWDLGLKIHELRHYTIGTLSVQSRALEGNPLGDPWIRHNPVLVPKGPVPNGGWPVVMMLSGFTGNGTFSFNLKGFERGVPEQIDRARDSGEAPDAVFVFCDAWTSWGGSQFLDSEGTGRYETYVGREIPQALEERLPVAKDAAKWCITGGSSGGYGALHLASRFPERFGFVAAIAPDSFFEASLMSEILTALPSIKKLGGVMGVREALDNGKFMKRRDAHTVLNAVAMGLCYASERGDVDWPVDLETGRVLPEVWARWKSHDPIEFLPKRKEAIARWKSVMLDVGLFDQFQLQYGARQIRDVLRAAGARLDYSEFEGNHFDIGERRPEVWKWLVKNWAT